MPSQRTFWIALTCGAFILTVATGLRATWGLFLKPMNIDIHISRELFGFAIAVQNVLWGALSPVAGAFADKFGSTRVIIVGALFYSAGLLVMAASNSGTELIIGNMLIGLALS